MGMGEHRVSGQRDGPFLQQQETETEAALRIYALGRLRVFYDQEPLDFPTRKAQDLLCFLLLYAEESLERDLVAERLWPMRPPGKARRCLSTALWRLRRTLRRLSSFAQAYVSAERTTLAFNTTVPYWYDVEVFERKATFGLAGSLPCTEDRRQALEEAVDLYCGDFLENCYDDWCLAEREWLRLLLLRVLKRLQRDYRLSRTFEEAISVGDRLLDLDPLQEDVHRELMRCYVDAGQRPLALEQFQHCRETLQRELQIEPMLETRRLYRQIRASQGSTLLNETHKDYRDSLQTAQVQFRRALDALESAWQALQAVVTEFTEESESA